MALMQHHKLHTASATAMCVTDRADVHRRSQPKPALMDCSHIQSPDMPF